MKKFKVGLIGTGYIGIIHLKMLRRFAEVEIVAVADANKQSANDVAKKFNVPKVFYTAGELIQEKEVEIIQKQVDPCPIRILKKSCDHSHNSYCNHDQGPRKVKR